MRLALYIETLGAEPVPIQHTGYRVWAAALHQQYEKLKVELDPGVFMQARSAARALIKQHTLPVAAQGLVPPVPNAPPKLRLAKTTLQVRSRPQKPTAYSPARPISAPPPPLPERTAPGRKLVRKSRRKLATLISSQPSSTPATTSGTSGKTTSISIPAKSATVSILDIGKPERLRQSRADGMGDAATFRDSFNSGTCAENRSGEEAIER